jgi:hypothetical protein
MSVDFSFVLDCGLIRVEARIILRLTGWRANDGLPFGDGVVLAQRVAHESLIPQEPADPGSVDEANTEHVPELPLEPVRSRPQRHNRVQHWLLAYGTVELKAGLNLEACLGIEAHEAIDHVETPSEGPCLRIGPIINSSKIHKNIIPFRF